MTEISQHKAALRKEAFARRKAAKSPARDARVVAHLLDAVLPHQGSVLAGYMPIHTEVDVVPVMAAMAAFGPVCVPVIEDKGKPLKFREWSPDCAMIDGPFGAAVPASGAWLEPSVILVPLVAFSRAGDRLGYGGGFYDRTLQKLRAGGEVTALGVAFADQRAEGLPLEPTDERLDGIVTEHGLDVF